MNIITGIKYLVGGGHCAMNWLDDLIYFFHLSIEVTLLSPLFCRKRSYAYRLKEVENFANLRGLKWGYEPSNVWRWSGPYPQCDVSSMTEQLPVAKEKIDFQRWT